MSSRIQGANASVCSEVKKQVLCHRIMTHIKKIFLVCSLLPLQYQFNIV